MHKATQHGWLCAFWAITRKFLSGRAASRGFAPVCMLPAGTRLARQTAGCHCHRKPNPRRRIFCATRRNFGKPHTVQNAPGRWAHTLLAHPVQAPSNPEVLNVQKPPVYYTLLSRPSGTFVYIRGSLAYTLNFSSPVVTISACGVYMNEPRITGKHNTLPEKHQTRRVVSHASSNHEREKRKINLQRNISTVNNFQKHFQYANLA